MGILSTGGHSLCACVYGNGKCSTITFPSPSQVLPDFILLHNCCDLVMPLEYVLVDNLVAQTDIETSTFIAIIRDNPAIVNGSDPSPSMDLMGTCVTATIGWGYPSAVMTVSSENGLRNPFVHVPCQCNSIWISMYPTWLWIMTSEIML